MADISTEERAAEALAARSDARKRECFLIDNKKFILACAYRAAGHYVSDSDDEWSIALLAFNEAIDTYDESKGSFDSFAALVIKRRVLNHLRSEGKFRSEIATKPEVIDGDEDEEEEKDAYFLEVRKKETELSMASGSTLDVKEEIEAAQELLRKYGFSFLSLSACSPKTGKTRCACAEAVRLLMREPALLKKLRDTGTLPMKELCASTGVPRRILDRHRRYIIAAAELLCGDYPHLSEYLRFIKEE